MANRNAYPSMNGDIGRFYLEFELIGAGASALTLGTGAAQWVTSVSRSGVGVFVVTLKDPWVKVVYKSAELDDTANDGSYATVSNVTNEGTASALQFTIRTRNAAGAAADPALNRKVGVALALRNSNSGLT